MSVTIKVSGIPVELLEQIDEIAATRGYTGRSEVVREALRAFLGEDAGKQPAKSAREIWERINRQATEAGDGLDHMDTSRESIYRP